MQIRKRLLKIIAETEQLVRDIEWWNNNRTEHAPMDCEGDRVAAQIGRKAVDALDAGDRESLAKLTDDLLRQLESNAAE
jgi:hypothetical protein